ncbi:hypothetical protein JCM16303_000008 [Sporobolomyces ruberrimus]
MVVRRVMLDAFGTVFSPSRPVFTQYAEVARTYGLSVVDDQVKVGFKRAFKRWIVLHPLYGKRSKPPLEPGDWWRGVIGDTFRYAGVEETKLEDIEASLSTTLVERFWGSEGYSLHPEFLSFLDSLERLGLPPPSIVSNTDPALVQILNNLGVSAQHLGPKGIKEEEIFTTWVIEREKQDVAFWGDVLGRLNKNLPIAQALKPEEVLVVGDELVADYETPRQAGYQSLLLRHQSADEEHNNPSYVDEIDGRRTDVYAVRDLTEVIAWLEKESGRT